jgi:hypothetical protein
MPISLDDLVTNAKYTDDMKFKIGDDEVSVADLRAYHRRGQEVSATAKRRQEEAEAEFLKAQKLGADALALYESVKGDADKKVKVDADGEIDWSDPVMKALKSKLDAFEAATKRYDDKAKQLEGAIATGFSFVTDYVWNQGYSSLDELSRPKDKKLEDLVKYAQEQKITDRWGLPDPVKAARMLTESDRQTAIEKKAREEGRKEGERAARAAGTPRPGTITPDTRQRVASDSKDKPKNMKELLRKAMADPEIQRVAGGLQDQ